MKICKSCECEFEPKRDDQTLCYGCELDKRIQDFLEAITGIDNYSIVRKYFRDHGCSYCSDFTEICVLEMQCKFTEEDFNQAKEINLTEIFIKPKKSQPIIKRSGVVITGKKFKVY